MNYIIDLRVSNSKEYNVPAWSFKEKVYLSPKDSNIFHVVINCRENIQDKFNVII